MLCAEPLEPPGRRERARPGARSTPPTSTARASSGRRPRATAQTPSSRRPPSWSRAYFEPDGDESRGCVERVRRRVHGHARSTSAREPPLRQPTTTSSSAATSSSTSTAPMQERLFQTVRRGARARRHPGAGQGRDAASAPARERLTLVDAARADLPAAGMSGGEIIVRVADLEVGGAGRRARDVGLGQLRRDRAPRRRGAGRRAGARPAAVAGAEPAGQQSRPSSPRPRSRACCERHGGSGARASPDHGAARRRRQHVRAAWRRRARSRWASATSSRLRAGAHPPRRAARRRGRRRRLRPHGAALRGGRPGRSRHRSAHGVHASSEPPHGPGRRRQRPSSGGC